MRALLDLVLPVECVCCRRPGAAWCVRCRRALAVSGFADGPQPVLPTPTPSGLPATVAWGPYVDPLQTAIAQWKDADRRDAGEVLSGLLAQAVSVALQRQGWHGLPVLLVPVPSSGAARRRRGDVPITDVAGHALRETARLRRSGLTRPLPAVEHRRRVADQAGLGVAGRAGNVARSMQVPARWAAVVEGRRCLIVDDVVTTGSTLAEVARALREAGAAAVCAATIAAAQLRRPSPARAPQAPRTRG